jgi:hypothetical protein
MLHSRKFLHLEWGGLQINKSTLNQCINIFAIVIHTHTEPHMFLVSLFPPPWLWLQSSVAHTASLCSAPPLPPPPLPPFPTSVSTYQRHWVWNLHATPVVMVTMVTLVKGQRTKSSKHTTVAILCSYVYILLQSITMTLLCCEDSVLFLIKKGMQTVFFMDSCTVNSTTEN